MEEKKTFNAISTKTNAKENEDKLKASVSSPRKSKRSVAGKPAEVDYSIYNNKSWQKIQLERNVQLVVVKHDEEDYTTIKTFIDVLQLIKEKPHLVVAIIPHLYHEFIDKKNSRIKIDFGIGDAVKYISKFSSNNNLPKKVTNLYFTSLNNMTVINVEFEDGQIELANRLIKHVE